MQAFRYSIRYNKQKSTPIIEEKIDWEEYATYTAKKEFILEPEWHAGKYYVQESSSMFLGYILESINIKNKDIIALDLCAAPGGKATHILDSISKNSILLTNEIIPKRNAVLRENIIRWGNSNIIITQNEPKHFAPLSHFFDLIVVDAPCSGEGLFKKNPDAKKEWSLENVAMCAKRQTEILEQIIPCVKEDGYLIYSTCTFQECENEAQIGYLLNNGFELVEINTEKFKEITIGKISNTFRFELEKVKGSGFFIACLKKKKNTTTSGKQISKTFYNTIESTVFKDLSHWIKDDEQYHTYTFKENLFAINKDFSALLNTIKNNLYITYFGLEIGCLKKNIFIPSHALALSNSIHPNVEVTKVDKQTAINYLRKKEIVLDNNFLASNKKSYWSVIQYEGLNLGWIKILQNRINNYLPNNWRILKQ